MHTIADVTIEVSSATRGGARDAIECLTAAFHDYPETVHLLPDERDRERVLPRYLGSDVRDALAHGLVHVARIDGVIVGAAAWLVPGAYPVGLGRQLAEAVSLAPIAPWGMRALAEARRGQAANRAAHRRFPPHHWLRVIGVGPAHQGRGVGAALLGAGLARADRKGAGAFLFTATEANAGWYQTFGFEIADQYRPTPTWPTTWAMWRPPSGPGS